MNTVFTVIFSAGLAALFGVVVLRLLSGQINTRGLVGRTPGALIVAIAIPVLYAVQALSVYRADPTHAVLPDAPEWMLVGAAGSQILYIAGKISRTVTQPKS
jgi:hypothetical protein